MARGGGSAEDLSPFNTELVARAIAAAKKPVVSAVGHETDFTIADFVADLRAPTPSAAAELVVFDQLGELSRLSVLATRANNVVTSHFKNKGSYMEAWVRRLEHTAKEVQQFQRSRLRELVFKLNQSVVTQAGERATSLKLLAKGLDTFNPVKILSLGYCRCVLDGKAVVSAADIRIGDLVDVVVKDGSLLTKVEKINLSKQTEKKK